MELVKIGKVKGNESNPRYIKEDKFKKLVKSIKDFPEMLKLRPIVVNKDMTVLGGNMRLKACVEAGLKEVYILKAEGLTKEQEDEFIVKDNLGFGEWDWDVLANEWDSVQLEEWGLEIPSLNEQIDELEDGEEIEIPQSVQVEPPKEYVLIVAEPNSVDWEELKQSLKLKMVRRGGYKKGSAFDAVSLERVLEWSELKTRIDVNSSTK